mmetsp:Transcript_3931/g.10375  ORF Transcript_3931/g.10375 Transcript_3931/m.10375 type:complete len:188 (-) Transcript_3931:93-656(-)
MSIFSVLAVDILGDVYSREATCEGDGGVCLAQCEEEAAVGITPRGHCFGFEYYGTFAKAWYTLFQITTGESWSEAAIRPALFFFQEHGFGVAGKVMIMVLVFLYVVVTSWIMLNVVVTVLLDKFTSFDSDPGASQNEPKDTRMVFDEMKVSVRDDLADLQETIEAIVMKISSLQKKDPQNEGAHTEQ